MDELRNGVEGHLFITVVDESSLRIDSDSKRDLGETFQNETVGMQLSQTFSFKQHSTAM